jgi:GT2 family glycosyltransferase
MPACEAVARRVVAIVVNWNGGAHLQRCVDALLEQTTAPSQIIVIDNASTDDSLRILPTAPTVRVERLSTNTGFAAACNLGVRLASDADWIALVNPDAFPDVRWLANLLTASERHPEYSFFASRQLLASHPDRVDGAGDIYSVAGRAWRRFNGALASRVDVAESREVFGPCAAAALYSREVWIDAGGFDESFFCYFEDVDLAFRLRLAGQRCLYVPEAIVHHVGSASMGRHSEFASYHGHRNLVWCWFKNMPLSLLLIYWPWHVLLNVLTVGEYARRGELRVVLRAKRDALRGLRAVLRQRRHVQSTRTVSASVLRNQMARGREMFGMWVDP